MFMSLILIVIKNKISAFIGLTLSNQKCESYESVHEHLNKTL